MDRIFQAIPRFSPLVLLAAAAVTLVAAHQVVDLRTGEQRIEIDSSFNRLVPEGDPHQEYYEFIRRLFGNDETLVVALAFDDVFTRDNLERIASLTRRIGGLDGVHHVVSLSNALNIRGTEGELDIAPLVDRIPEDRAGLERLRREVLDNPIYAGNLISSDGRATALLVYPDHDLTDREFVERELDHQIEAIANEEAGDAEVSLTGTPYIKANTQRRIVRDLSRGLPLVILIVAGVLLVSFRTVGGVVVPLVTVGIALVWTLGTISAIGGSLNTVTAIIPVLLLAIGGAYVVHVVSEVYEELRGGDVAAGMPQLIGAATRRVAHPVALTGVTTIAGFASLALSPMSAIREFGLYFAGGIAYTVFASLTIAPALLRLFPRPRAAEPAAVAGTTGARFDRFAGAVALFDANHRVGIFVGAAAVMALSIYGATQMRVGVKYIEDFKRSSPVRIGFEAINEHLGGANPFYVVVATDYTDAFMEPVNLREVEALQEWLEAQPEIGGTTSIVDYLKLINRGFHENDPAHLAIPKTRRMTSQLLFFGTNDEMERFVDSRFQIANILVRARVIDSNEVSLLIRRIEERLAALPERFEGRVTGNSIVMNRAFDGIVRGQLTSMIGALGIIYLILSVMFMDPRVGFMALLPNVLPVAAYFGALGFTGISLDPTTSLVAPMAIGIAVDDTIHYFNRFNIDSRRLADDRAAAVSALTRVGRPVTYTSVSLCLGFLALTISESRTAVGVGLLSSFTLAFAWLADFVLTPAICSRLRIATLWDVLTLDLGPEPHRMIPLLKGLSRTQAKIVGRMLAVERVPAGTEIMRTGDVGEDLYVVIDGQFRAYRPGPDGPVELSTMSRGDSFGEVGLFYEERTANVEALTDARLLRLTQSNLRSLGRRYPRTAYRVHRNLNEILAGIVARLTKRLS